MKDRDNTGAGQADSAELQSQWREGLSAEEHARVLKGLEKLAAVSPSPMLKAKLLAIPGRVRACRVQEGRRLWSMKIAAPMALSLVVLFSLGYGLRDAAGPKPLSGEEVLAGDYLESLVAYDEAFEIFDQDLMLLEDL